MRFAPFLWSHIPLFVLTASSATVWFQPASELKRLAKHHSNVRTQAVSLPNSLQGLKETPQAINLPALESAIKVARQTWAGDRFIFVEGVQCFADEDLLGLFDVKIMLRASYETCAANYTSDLRYFDEFAWPLYEQFNEGFLGETNPSCAVAFHSINADAPLNTVFEATHRTLTRY